VCPYAAQIATAYRASPLLRDTPRVLLAAWGSWWPGNDAKPSRARALAWVKAVREGGAKWLEHRQISRAEWWWELRKYRFILNPIGACVQNVRIWEALLMGVVPIGDASSLADRMLQAEGYPLVLVDDWALISEARLATWHELLLPRVAAIRPLLNAQAMHARLAEGLTVNDVLGGHTEWERLLPSILLLHRPEPEDNSHHARGVPTTVRATAARRKYII
jgi:fumarate reductase subunit C